MYSFLYKLFLSIILVQFGFSGYSWAMEDWASKEEDLFEWQRDSVGHTLVKLPPRQRISIQGKYVTGSSAFEWAKIPIRSRTYTLAGYRLRIYEGDLYNGELGLFCKNGRLYCKILNKKEMEIIKSDNPLTGLSLEIFDRILKTLQENEPVHLNLKCPFENWIGNQALQSITDLDQKALLRYAFTQGYIPLVEWKLGLDLFTHDFRSHGFGSNSSFNIGSIEWYLEPHILQIRNEFPHHRLRLISKEFLEYIKEGEVGIFYKDDQLYYKIGEKASNKKILPMSDIRYAKSFTQLIDAMKNSEALDAMQEKCNLMWIYNLRPYIQHFKRRLPNKGLTFIIEKSLKSKRYIEYIEDILAHYFLYLKKILPNHPLRLIDERNINHKFLQEREIGIFCKNDNLFYKVGGKRPIKNIQSTFSPPYSEAFAQLVKVMKKPRNLYYLNLRRESKLCKPIQEYKNWDGLSPFLYSVERGEKNKNFLVLYFNQRTKSEGWPLLTIELLKKTLDGESAIFKHHPNTHPFFHDFDIPTAILPIINLSANVNNSSQSFVLSSKNQGNIDSDQKDKDTFENFCKSPIITEKSQKKLEIADSSRVQKDLIEILNAVANQEIDQESINNGLSCIGGGYSSATVQGLTLNRSLFAVIKSFKKIEEGQQEFYDSVHACYTINPSREFKMARVLGVTKSHMLGELSIVYEGAQGMELSKILNFHNDEPVVDALTSIAHFLAKFHFQSYQTREKTHCYTASKVARSRTLLLIKRMNHFLERCNPYISTPSIREFLEKVLVDFKENSAGLPSSSIHGDFHALNIIFNSQLSTNNEIYKTTLIDYASMNKSGFIADDIGRLIGSLYDFGARQLWKASYSEDEFRGYRLRCLPQDSLNSLKEEELALFCEGDKLFCKVKDKNIWQVMRADDTAIDGLDSSTFDIILENLKNITSYNKKEDSLSPINFNSIQKKSIEKLMQYLSKYNYTQFYFTPREIFQKILYWQEKFLEAYIKHSNFFKLRQKIPNKETCFPDVELLLKNVNFSKLCFFNMILASPRSSDAIKQRLMELWNMELEIWDGLRITGGGLPVRKEKKENQWEVRLKETEKRAKFSFQTIFQPLIFELKEIMNTDMLSEVELALQRHLFIGYSIKEDGNLTFSRENFIKYKGIPIFFESRKIHAFIKIFFNKPLLEYIEKAKLNIEPYKELIRNITSSSLKNIQGFINFYENLILFSNKLHFDIFSRYYGKNKECNNCGQAGVEQKKTFDGCVGECWVCGHVDEYVFEQ